MKKNYVEPLLLDIKLMISDVIMVSENAELDFDVGDLVGGVEQ